MSTLQQEKDLLFDRDLHRKMAATGPLATATAWLGAASALSLRSLPHLTAELTGRGLKQFPREDGLWMEYIRAVSLYPEKLHKAWEDLSAAKKPPKDVQVLLALVEYFLEQDAEGQERLEAIAEGKRNARFYEVSGHYAMARHDYRSAVRDYRQAHRLAPKDLRLMYHLGEGYDALGDVGKALQWLYRAVGRERHFVQAWNALCRIHLKLRQLDRARQAMGMALAVNPRDWGVYFTFADDYLERGLFGRARAILKDILDLQPRDVIAAEVHNYLGYLFFLKGHYAEAMPCFQKAIELNPGLAVAWLNLGNLHFHRKKMDEARKCYQEALRVDRNMASASCQLGLIEMDQGRLDKARDPLERALALDPGEYWAHLGLSEYHRRTKNYVGALSEAQKALRIAPESADVYNYLGIALECNRRYFDAEKAYRRALELDPLNRWAANNLGYLYEKLMRVAPEYKGSAIEAWKRRLLICRDTGASMRGAVNHLEKLGVRPPVLRRWIEHEPGPKAH